jgi:hypothetical protein
MSSLSFIGNATSYLRIPNTTDFNFGTGDFTIEWYQYQTDSNPFPRIFQIGTYNTVTSIGVSIEGGQFYYWRNGSPTGAISLNLSPYKNVWVHFAISRATGNTQIFMNGTLMLTMSDTTDFSSSDDLVIGNESSPTDNAAFGGLIYYFSWVKGVALYTSNFTPSYNYPTVTSDYMLLLKATGFEGTLGSTVVNNSNLVTNVAGAPTAPEPPPTPPPSFTPPTNMKKSLFSNNAMVYYKSGSLAPGGVGGVGNASIKARKT